MTESRNFRSSFQHTVQKSSLLHVDAVHALHEQLALVLAVDEMLADGAYIVDNSHHGSEVAGRRCAESPHVGVLEGQLVVHHGGYAVRYIGKSAASYTKEFVRRDVGRVNAPVLHVDHSVGGVLHSVCDHIAFRIDFFYSPDDLFDVHDVSGDVGCSHDADKAGVLVHVFHNLIYVNPSGGLVGRNLPEFSPCLRAGVLYSVVC